MPSDNDEYMEDNENCMNNTVILAFASVVERTMTQFTKIHQLFN